MNFRIDFIFSYWIFFWFILYYFNLIKYSPKFAILLGIIIDLILLFAMIYYKTNIDIILKFILIILIIKIYPYYKMYKEPIKLIDIQVSILVFLIYLMWIHKNGNTMIDYYNKMAKSLIEGKSETPFMYFLKK
jgi:hypothetical protein